MISSTFNLKKNKDLRVSLKKLIDKNKTITFWESGLDLNFLIILPKNFFTLFNLTSVYNKNNTFLTISHNVNLLTNILLKNSLLNIWFNVDCSINKLTGVNVIIQTHSCVFTNQRITLLSKSKNNNFDSLSKIFFSTNWTERELQEFSTLKFTNLCDSRRLLTDYTYHNNIFFENYKTTSYNVIEQDLYTRVLHWLLFFSYCFTIICLSFLLYNKSLLHLVILSELLIIIISLISAIISLYFNIYYLLGFILLLLIFGGLELAVNLLILTIIDENFI